MHATTVKNSTSENHEPITRPRNIQRVNNDPPATSPSTPTVRHKTTRVARETSSQSALLFVTKNNRSKKKAHLRLSTTLALGVRYESFQNSST